MADENESAAAAAANTTINRPAPSTPAAEQAARDSRNPPFKPAMGAAPTPKNVARSPLITNPTPMRDPDAPVTIEDNTPSELPAGTIAEMEAGKKALERNKPVYARVAEREADVTPKE